MKLRLRDLGKIWLIWVLALAFGPSEPADASSMQAAPYVHLTTPYASFPYGTLVLLLIPKHVKTAALLPGAKQHNQGIAAHGSLGIVQRPLASQLSAAGRPPAARQCNTHSAQARGPVCPSTHRLPGRAEAH